MDTAKKSSSALASKEEGNTLFRSGNYEEAAKKYKEAIALDPSVPTFYTNLCNCYKKLGKFEEMEISARTCIQLDKNFMKGYYNLAISFTARKMIRDALKACEDALKLNPGHQDITKLYDDIKRMLVDDPLEDLMKECNLVPSTDSLGNVILVSEELAGSKFKSADGSIDLNKVLDSPRRGSCGYLNCQTDHKGQGIKLSRCSRCWQVDYCSRACQKADWKRHKIECKENSERGHTSTNTASPNVGWQALVNQGYYCLRKKDYKQALECFSNALDNNVGMNSLLPLISTCFLESGNTVIALDHAYQACQGAHSDLMSWVVKARCHEKLDDIEAAYLSCYSVYNSHLCMNDKSEGALDIVNTHILPLMQSLTGKLVGHIMSKTQNITESSFPIKLKISTVPFSMDYKNGQGVLIMQDLGGTGFHLCQPKKNYSSFPTIQEHSGISYKSSVIVFGGIDAFGTVTNEIRIFEIDSQNNYSHHVQPCSGNIPPPSQGHSACIIAENMYVFGGSGVLEDMYVLDLVQWKWEKMDTMSKTPPLDCPETDVCFSELIKFDRDSILLVGGLRGEAIRSASGQNNHYGFSSFDGQADVIAQNMHLYSFKMGTWKRIPNSSDAPYGWGLRANNVDDKKVLVLSGQSGPVDEMKTNSLHILSYNSMGSLKWTRVCENAVGIPPPISIFRASTWVPSTQSLYLYGGKYCRVHIEDSVMKHKDSGSDLTSECKYDTELYCFNLSSKQWFRLRVAKVARPRHSHIMNEIDGKLVILGGCCVASGLKGFRGEREYVTEVISYDLNLLAFAHQCNSTTKLGKKFH